MPKIKTAGHDGGCFITGYSRSR